jgi:hypothetical protein
MLSKLDQSVSKGKPVETSKNKNRDHAASGNSHTLFNDGSPINAHQLINYQSSCLPKLGHLWIFLNDFSSFPIVRAVPFTSSF